MRTGTQSNGLGSSDTVGTGPTPGGYYHASVAAAVVDCSRFAHVVVRGNARTTEGLDKIFVGFYWCFRCFLSSYGEKNWV